MSGQIIFYAPHLTLLIPSDHVSNDWNENYAPSFPSYLHLLSPLKETNNSPVKLSDTVERNPLLIYSLSFSKVMLFKLWKTLCYALLILYVRQEHFVLLCWDNHVLDFHYKRGLWLAPHTDASRCLLFYCICWLCCDCVYEQLRSRHHALRLFSLCLRISSKYTRSWTTELSVLCQHFLILFEQGSKTIICPKYGN